MKMRYLATGLVALILPVSALGGGASATVKVADDFFSPSTVKVEPGERVEWKWDGSNSNVHRVTLSDAPKGVDKKDFSSKSGVTAVKFNPRFQRRGSYDFICQFHPTLMQMTVKVKG